MKLSKKQKEVIGLLRNHKNHSLHWLGGLNPHCFISHNLNYPLSITTAFKLMDLGLIKADDENTHNKTYHLTELGKTIEL